MVNTLGKGDKKVIKVKRVIKVQGESFTKERNTSPFGISEAKSVRFNYAHKVPDEAQKD